MQHADGSQGIGDGEIELDLSDVRSRITNLSAGTIDIATDLLAVLAPFDTERSEHQERPRETVELARTRTPAAVFELPVGPSDQVWR